VLAVIGCGNPTRSDDGCGIEVVRRLRDHNPSERAEWLRFFDAGTAGLEVMFQARGCAALILVDACQSGSEPGAVFAVPEEELTQSSEPAINLHEFRWDHALYAGRKIFGQEFPTEVWVFLIEAESLAFGIELSPSVQAAIPQVVQQVQARIDAYAQRR
jgi:hydrogenase maturation protease